MAVEREIARYQSQTAGSSTSKFSWQVSLKDFPHPALDTVTIVGQVLGPFLFAANMFGFVLTVSAGSPHAAAVPLSV